MNGKVAKKLRKEVYGNRPITVKAINSFEGQRITDPDRRKYQSLKRKHYRTEDKKPLEKNVR